jgi:head-tail adaptor
LNSLNVSLGRSRSRSKSLQNVVDAFADAVEAVTTFEDEKRIYADASNYASDTRIASNRYLAATGGKNIRIV